MEINHYGDTILGVVLTADTVEGRMVLLTAHTWTKDFGSLTDLPGAKVPATALESIRARYVVTWQQDNQSLPLYQGTQLTGQPAFGYAMRYGFDQAANAPFAATVYITKPGQQECLTIPSGASALAFGEGIYTVNSGCYMNSGSISIPGMPLAVCNTDEDGAADAGKLKYSTTNPVAEVYHYDTTTGKLTFKILH
jgi:hypothetical protein